jgi:hypothetical protein
MRPFYQRMRVCTTDRLYDFEHLTTLGFMRRGHEKTVRELDLTTRGLCHFNSVAPSEVKGRFSIHDLLARCVWPIHILLRMVDAMRGEFSGRLGLLAKFWTGSLV